MIRVETETLVTLIHRCFEYSTDQRFEPSDQKRFLALGKMLRGSLMNLLSAQFNEGTKRVIDANARLHQVNTDLADAAAVLAKTAATLEQIGKLVGVLNRLLNIAANFL